jgi:hypothetical protein
VKLALEVTGYIELLQQRGTGWRKSDVENGVWFRDVALDRDVDPTTAAGMSNGL